MAPPRGRLVFLRRTTAGCRWMLARWSALADSLDRERAWAPSEYATALHLLGKRADEVFSDPMTVRVCAEAGCGSGEHGSTGAPVVPTERHQFAPSCGRRKGPVTPLILLRCRSGRNGV